MALSLAGDSLSHTPFMPIIREIEWNAINLKRGIRLASHDINFYKAFIQELNRQRSRIKL